MNPAFWLPIGNDTSITGIEISITKRLRESRLNAAYGNDNSNCLHKLLRVRQKSNNLFQPTQISGGG